MLPQVHAYKRAFCTELIEAFTGVLSGELRRRAKRAFGLRSAGEAHGGLVVFVQRSDGALRLNVHLHVLALDGVYVRNADGTLEFRVLQPPTREEVHRVAERMHGRLERLCAKHGVCCPSRNPTANRPLVFVTTRARGLTFGAGLARGRRWTKASDDGQRLASA